jgi:hypothetical protein
MWKVDRGYRDVEQELENLLKRLYHLDMYLEGPEWMFGKWMYAEWKIERSSLRKKIGKLQDRLREEVV